MAHVYTGDLPLETTTTTGTGALTLAGAVAGHQTLAQSGVANADTVELIIRAVNSNGIPTGDWERSICTYSTTGPTITRTTVLQSSNSDAAVNFAAGTKRVYRVATREHEHLYKHAIECGHSGLVSGGTITNNADPSKLDIAAGSGWIYSGTGIPIPVSWSTQTAVPNIGLGYMHVAFDASGTINTSATKQSLLSYVYVGYGFYNAAAGAFTTRWNTPEWAGNYGARVSKFVREAFGAIISTGGEVTPGASALTLNVAAMTSYFNLTEITRAATNPATFLRLYGNTDQIVSIEGSTSGETTLNVTQWNDATQVAASALVTMTNGFWKKDVLIINPDGNAYYSIGRAEYATEAEARAADIPGFSTFYPDLNIFCAEIIIQKGISSITADKIVDIRPTMPRIFFDRPPIYYDQLLNLPDHDELPNISGGAVGEYNHLNDSIYALATAMTASYTAAEQTKLAGIASGATVGATWGTNITSQPSVVPQAEAEAGSATTERIWTAQRVNQAIQALAPGGGGGLSEASVLARVVIGV